MDFNIGLSERTVLELVVIYIVSVSYEFCIFDTVKRKKIRKPKPWAHTEPITRAQLTNMREEFWDTSPHYGGQRGIYIFISLSCNLHLEAELKLLKTRDLGGTSSCC